MQSAFESDIDSILDLGHYNLAIDTTLHKRHIDDIIDTTSSSSNPDSLNDLPVTHLDERDHSNDQDVSAFQRLRSFTDHITDNDHNTHTHNKKRDSDLEAGHSHKSWLDPSWMKTLSFLDLTRSEVEGMQTLDEDGKPVHNRNIFDNMWSNVKFSRDKHPESRLQATTVDVVANELADSLKTVVVTIGDVSDPAIRRKSM